MNQNFPNEAPFQPVESLFKVNLKGHNTSATLFSPHGVEDFLGYYHVISAFPAKDEGSLKRGDQLVHERSNSIDDYLCHSFVNCCAQANWPKMPKKFRASPLRNKNNKSLI